VAWDATVKKIAQCKADGCAVVSRVGAIVGALVCNGVQWCAVVCAAGSRAAMDNKENEMKRRLMGQ
jgi:hypothetical protein